MGLAVRLVQSSTDFVLGVSTRERRFLLGFSDTPECSACGEVDGLVHALWIYSTHSSSRDELLRRVSDV